MQTKMNSSMIFCPFDENGNRKAFLLPMKVTAENLHAYEASGWLACNDENKNPQIDKMCIIDPEVETIVKLKGNKLAEQLIDPIIEVLIENNKSVFQIEQNDTLNDALNDALNEAIREEEYIRESLKDDVSNKAIIARRDARKKREAIQKQINGC
jgi:hypothetical protein